MFKVIDTHTHLDAEEFDEDRAEAFARAREAGVGKVFLPAIDVKTTHAVLALSREYPGYAYPMIGLHPEEVKADWKEQLAELRKMQISDFIAIGEIGLDYYWSREFEQEQLEAFEEQVKWSVETRLPLMIHCRKAQNEMVHLLRQYQKDLPGGVFHCFTGNQKEAEELLSFDNFVLGIGGVSTFKSSHLREDLPAAVPMNRIILETDSPYMAPVPYRGKRNESAFVIEVLKTLAKAYILSAKSEDVDKILGLNIGADDYVTKPFNPLELVARVKSQLRRYTKLGNLPADDGENVYQVGGLLVNDDLKEVSVEGEPVKLTPIEYNILLLLVKNPGKVFSIEQIYESIWNEEAIGADNTVAVHIRHIREKIEINPKEPRYLKVVWGIGYKIEKQ